MINGLPPRLAESLERADVAIRERGIEPGHPLWDEAFALEWTYQMCNWTPTPEELRRIQRVAIAAKVAMDNADDTADGYLILRGDGYCLLDALENR